MILVRLWGGLGNQLFQYASARALAEKHHCELKIDTSLLYENLNDPLTVKREFDLEVFKIEAPLASKEEIAFFNPPTNSISQKLKAKGINLLYPKRIYSEKYFHFDSELSMQKPPLCIIGNWQSHKYFEEIEDKIRAELKFNKELEANSIELAKEIENSQSVCINVRRGDYIWHPDFNRVLGFRGLEYLIPAVQQIKTEIEKPKFFIFSDDLDWCEKYLYPEIGGTIVNHQYKGWKFGNYLQLMTLCKHHIIPNSTFGWWAAWLGKKSKQIVITPKKWYQDPLFNTKDLCLKEWIKL